MKHKIQALSPDGTQQLFITIRLDDECNNGHQDFAITANVYEAGKPTTDRNMICGGCCHDDILAARPDLKMFVDLHLADYDGVPMYAVENGFHHLKQGFNNTKPSDDGFQAEFCDYYRITGEQFDVLNRCETQIQYALALQSLGVLGQWKAQAAKAIAALEEMTGETFTNTSVKSQFHAPTPEQVEEENAKIASGYYTEEAREGREQAAMQDRIEKILAEAEAKIQSIRDEATIKIQVLRIGGNAAFNNSIVYTHTRQLVFNWLSYSTRVSQEVIDKIVAEIVWPDGYSLGEYKER